MKTFTCSVAQKGFFAGPVYYIHKIAVKESRTNDPETELKRLEEATGTLKTQIAENRTSGENAEIMKIVLSILSDDVFIGQIIQNVSEKSLDVVSAIEGAAEELANELGKVESEYIRTRVDDIRGVADKLISILAGNENGPAECSAICAEEISPAQISSISEDLIGGMLTDKGSPNSHASILAGNMGIPYLYGNQEAVVEAGKASFVILDSETGTVIIDPDEVTRRVALERMTEMKKKPETEARVQKDDEEPIVCRTKVYANIEGPQDIEELLASGADGVGLFRTEFLFLLRDTIPTEEEQYEAYSTVLRAMGEKEVIIRTMDVGSDKRVPWLEIPEESNPALGLRGVRVSLERKELFHTQLRALLRSATEGNLKVMFPMITSVWEINEIKGLVEETAEELKREGIAYKVPALGIMVETPAAALCAEELAGKVSFFSIGTNDLTQYTLALDREAQGLDRYFKPYHDAIFKLIKMTVEGAHKHGAVTGVCGQLAGDPKAVERLIEAGVEELSVPIRKVKETKELAAVAEIAIREKTVPESRSFHDDYCGGAEFIKKEAMISGRI